jgi:alkanesulfonate monooxygenase SsuD/methylene tetrahydromethanopterin reductase-like flavin-dependent oxidoreductase (luciferase family)
MTRTVSHLGLILPNFGPVLDRDRLVATVQTAEQVGFDSAWATDHLMVPAAHADVYGTIAEPLVTVGLLSGVTQTIHLGVSALIVPARNPLVVLKQLSSLDFLSGGRFLSAVAPGWLEAEFATLGADFRHRGRVLDEWLDLAEAVFAQMPGPVHHQNGFKVEDAWLSPGLVHRPSLELWIAGNSAIAAHRAAKTGTWHPVSLTPSALAPLAQELRLLRQDARVILRVSTRFAAEPNSDATDERGRHTIEGPPDWIAARLNDFVDAGCDGFVVDLDVMSAGLEERVGQFAEDVRPLLS